MKKNRLEKTEAVGASQAAQGEKNESAQPTEVGCDIITEPTLCARLEISRGTAISLRNAGKLPFIRLGKQVRYSWSTVHETLSRTQRQAA